MPGKRDRPPITREARENLMMDLAIDQVEEQLRNKTASSQVLVHYLKLASTREKREKEKMEAEIELLHAKRDAAAAEARNGELYEKAIRAMREYQGAEDYEIEEDDVGLY